ncbi:LacI family DNA-binding transcriptional regulator [Streptomyces phaeochromogenes]|uniref:LacI family DNA-binding transcriptional regulator n=1 Tax=Streptomyces phaeochromogenes TaxID=1923 RepID=UPI0033E1FB72
MADVGRLAGVTHQTVSRVLNGKGYVKESTRIKVEEAIRELSYRPNRIARSLTRGRSETVGVLAVRGPGNGIFESLLHGLTRAAGEAGYSVVIANLNEDPGTRAADAAVIRTFERFISEGVDGVIVLTGYYDLVNSVRAGAGALPVAMVFGPAIDGISVTTIDSFRGGELAAEHLLKLGHRAIVHVAGVRGRHDSDQREAGFRAALARYELEPVAVLHGSWTPRSGYEIGRELCSRKDFTAVFAANDQMALGVIHALTAGGRRVPDDVSVVGYDDIEEAPYFIPPLTSVRQDFELLGSRALSSLLTVVSYGSTEHISIRPALTVRESTASPRA